MNEQEKFDDLLRSKLSERDFPFDETNWDKAEAAIERSEKRRRIGIVSVIFLAGLLVGIGIMYPFVHTSNKTEFASNNASAIPDNNSVAVNNKNATSTGNVSSRKEENTNTTNTSASQTNAAVNLGTTAPQVQQQSTIHTQSNSVTASQHQQLAANTANNNSPVSEATDVVPPAKKEKHKKHKTAADTGAIAYDYVRPSTQKSSKKEHKYVNTGNPYTINSSNTSENITTAQNNTATNSINNNSVIVDDNKTTIANNSTSSSVQQNTKQDSTKLAAVIKDSTKKDSSTNNSIAQTNSQEPQATTKYSHTLVSVDAGTNYSLGWMKAGATQGNGFNPILGFSATHYFSTKISALVGLQYNSLSNINTLYSANSNQYSFGAENGVTSVTIKTLYYLALPLKFQFSINDNNIVSIGAHICYLITSNSNVVSYTQDYFGTSGYTSAYKTGYTDGINPWDAQITLAYRRKINRFSITAEGYYGLMDIENNNFFNNNVFERNSGLRLLLSYDILK